MTLLEYGSLVFKTVLSHLSCDYQIKEPAESAQFIYLFKPIPKVSQYQLRCIFIVVSFLSLQICSSQTGLLTKGLQMTIR